MEETETEEMESEIEGDRESEFVHVCVCVYEDGCMCVWGGISGYAWGICV